MTQKQDDQSCCEFPAFKRLNYYYGQMLGARDFETEQEYFRNKHLLHNRCLHGWGVVCGLVVSPAEPDADQRASGDAAQREPDAQRQEPAEAQHRDPLSEIDSETDVADVRQQGGKDDDAQQQGGKDEPGDDDRRCHPRVVVSCGMAIDTCGNDVILHEACPVRVPAEDGDYYIIICYHEADVERTKTPAPCSNPCTYAKKIERACVQVTETKPPDDDDPACDVCCCPSERHECQYLARVRVARGKVIHVDNSIRRPLSTYPLTTIEYVNWVHGAHYTEEEAEARLDKGLTVHFSRPVLSASIQPGVVDVWVTDDTTGRSAGAFRRLTTTAKPGDTDGSITRTMVVNVDYRGLTQDEKVLIIVRADFILDRCCQAVDGNHIGGWVQPAPGTDLPASTKRRTDPDKLCCPAIPNRLGPWTSGNGSPGGTFESWFFVKAVDRDRGDAKYEQRGE